MGRSDSGHDDDGLLDDLSDAVRSRGSVPASYAEAARAAYTWRTIDAELAMLAYDSSVSEPVRVRGTGSPRVLVFGSGDLTVHLEVRDGGLTGQLDPPRPGRVGLEEAARGVVCRATVEDDGFFTLDCPTSGPVRLRLAENPLTVTEWLTF
jgi:hypothetical protein